MSEVLSPALVTARSDSTRSSLREIDLEALSREKAVVSACLNYAWRSPTPLPGVSTSAMLRSMSRGGQIYNTRVMGRKQSEVKHILGRYSW